MNVYTIISIVGAVLAIIVLTLVKEDTKLFGILLTLSLLLIIIPPVVWKIEIIRHLV